MNIKSYLSPKTRVKKSPIGGRGLFAIQLIKKGELACIKGGHIIDWKTLKKIENLIGDSYIKIDDNFVLAPSNKKEVKKIMMFLNHSCEPNIGVRGEITFVAMRNIKAGEELTADYATIEAGTNYKIRCGCRKKNCRKVITGNDWEDKNLQKKYKSYFSRYIQDKIENLRIKR